MRVLHPHTNTQPEDIQEGCVIERERNSGMACPFSSVHSDLV